MSPDRVTARDLPSPNHDSRPADQPIDMLILHYTGMRSADEAIARLRDPAPPTGIRVSSHYVVDEDGSVWRLLAEELRGWHAGVSYWRGHRTLNGRSIGIEIVNPGHEFGYRPFPVIQLAAVCDLCLDILDRHPIPPRNVVGHSDVAPDRKQDPGELFPWQDLAANGVGLWPAKPIPTVAPQRDVAELLRTIGYDVPPDADARVRTIALTAFQRHWRPECVDGEADAGTRARLAAVAAA
jgi:N-acetylmuramoyl-L-alanine amidase